MVRISRWTTGAVLLGAAGLAIGSAAGQGTSKHWPFDISTCGSGVSHTVAVSKTHAAHSFEFTGTTHSNTRGGAFDMVTFRCVGMVNVLEGKSPGAFTCESVDLDGDKYFTRYTGDGVKYAGTLLAGTGKYERVAATFISESAGPLAVATPGTFQNCSRETGTYTRR